MDLTTMRSHLRVDLHDEDPTGYRWTDATLNRHIDRAVKEYGRAWPLTANVSIAATSSRRYDLSAQAGYLWCERAEYPVDDDPPGFLPFREESVGAVYLLAGEPPVAGENIKFWYVRAHTLDVAGSTIPQEHEELVALGAAGYAAVELANYAMGHLNTSGDTPQWYRAWGEARLREFRAELERLRAARSLEVARMVHWGAVPRTWEKV
ncbi:MAG: hypothetical protein M1370_04400 [Bacteroidetes bacterium]|nr:hypothetical protein [Bacteroidota bacterium]